MSDVVEFRLRPANHQNGFEKGGALQRPQKQAHHLPRRGYDVKRGLRGVRGHHEIDDLGRDVVAACAAVTIPETSSSCPVAASTVFSGS